MVENLLRDSWKDLDSAELRILLDQRIGGPGQYQDQIKNPYKFHLPLVASCQITLTFRDQKIVAIQPGPAFDPDKWKQVCREIESLTLPGPVTIGRGWSFSGLRVLGSWRGKYSGVQILPPPSGAPLAPVEHADHPFILEFPVKATELRPLLQYRLAREHRRLTLLLNILLAGGTSLQVRRPRHLWAAVPGADGHFLGSLRANGAENSQRKRIRLLSGYAVWLRVKPAALVARAPAREPQSTRNLEAS